MVVTLLEEVWTAAALLLENTRVLPDASLRAWTEFLSGLCALINALALLVVVVLHTLVVALMFPLAATLMFTCMLGGLGIRR
jgi:hypothetical protein